MRIHSLLCNTKSTLSYLYFLNFISKHFTLHKFGPTVSCCFPAKNHWQLLLI
uniref:Phytochrome B n=1 Tax=Rhizophora mucronata TaxID=61149 RepID=A0A2P2PIT8_RHIMU